MSRRPSTMQGLLDTTLNLGRQDFQCPVCLEETSDDVTEIANCHHQFHSDCLRTWLWKSPTCPLCREVLFGFEYFLELTTEEFNSYVCDQVCHGVSENELLRQIALLDYPPEILTPDHLASYLEINGQELERRLNNMNACMEILITRRIAAERGFPSAMVRTTLQEIHHVEVPDVGTPSPLERLEVLESRTLENDRRSSHLHEVFSHIADARSTTVSYTRQRGAGPTLLPGRDRGVVTINVVGVRTISVHVTVDRRSDAVDAPSAFQGIHEGEDEHFATHTTITGGCTSGENSRSRNGGGGFFGRVRRFFH